MESKNLIIIGNGFDIHHGLETQYSHFRQFLLKSGRVNYVNQLETFFQSEYLDKNGKRQYLLWSNLEKAIGQYDLEELYHELTDWVDIDYDHMMRSAAQIEDSPKDFLAPVVEDLPILMKEWISQLSITDVCPDVMFPTPSVFLSFNYTRVLEEVYHIPEGSILHIHGVLGSNSDLIVGHQGTFEESDAFDEGTPLFQDEAKRNIISIMNECRKPTRDLIANNSRFFQSLKDVTDVYVYGHSYSLVDKDYYEKVKDSVPSGTKWHLGCFSDGDKRDAEAMMKHIRVTNELWSRFQF